MTASPQICPGCAHVFPPGTPEPSWCPDCGRICSALDPPYQPPPPPEEYPMTDGDRRRWRLGFWGLLLLGPALTALTGPLLWTAASLLPPLIVSVLQAIRPAFIIAIPCVAAVGAAFCLARSQRAVRSRVEFVVFVMWAAGGLLLAQVVLFIVALGVAVGFLR